MLEDRVFDEISGFPKTVQQPRCPICDHDTSILDCVDFNIYPEKTGIPIYYNICSHCDFCFSPEMYKWSPEEFGKYVYNEFYVKVDPDYVYKRPAEDAATIINRFGSVKHQIRHLDYGGGQGVLSSILRENGFDSIAYDPFVNKDVNLSDLGKFDLITSFEVFEHVPDVHHLMTTLGGLRKDNGVIYFSTLMSDGNIKRGERLHWWYAAPRNGHISLFSNKSLSIISEKYGLKLGHFNESRHLMWGDIVPSWAIGTVL